MDNTLIKASLIPANGEKAQEIQFMFNPTELKFSRSVAIEQAKGSSTDKGQNKTSFKHPNPYQLTISNVILDTYEETEKDKRNVLKKLEPFKLAVVYSKANPPPEPPAKAPTKGVAKGTPKKGSKGDEKRPPIYLFTWGQTAYLRCFVKTFNFRLTMFLPDGTPVRAIVDLTLEQVDDPKPQPTMDTPKVGKDQREQDKRPFFE
jgi:hypothetical protein